jgi:membrane-associated phospholipid phosphatase
VIADPFATDAVQGIAAFASLHVAVVFTAALVAQLAGAPRALRAVLWAYLGITVLATIYFGWHYVSDDVAGVAIGVVAVYAAGYLVGEESRLPVLGAGARRVSPSR